MALVLKRKKRAEEDTALGRVEFSGEGSDHPLPISQVDHLMSWEGAVLTLPS